jgi:hypothetical protein
MRSARNLLLLCLAFCGLLGATLPRGRTLRADNPPAPAPVLSLGIDPDEAQAKLGLPARISRQVFSHRAREQWLYGPPHNLRLLFDCPRGQKPALLRVRPVKALTP